MLKIYNSVNNLIKCFEVSQFLSPWIYCVASFAVNMYVINTNEFIKSSFVIVHLTYREFIISVYMCSILLTCLEPVSRKVFV